MTPAEQLAEAILSAAGSGLRHYTPNSRLRIIDAAARWIDDIRLNAICDERKPDGGIPVRLGELQWPAAPLQPTPQPRNDPAGYVGPSDTINAPHGAENGADNG